MNALLLVFTCFTGLFAFAFLIAGYGSLLMADQKEMADLQRKLNQAPSSGLFGDWILHTRMQNGLSSPRRIFAKWRERGDIRRLIYIGLAFLVVALISGQFTVLPR